MQLNSRIAVGCALLLVALMGRSDRVAAAQPNIVSVTHGNVDASMPPSAPTQQKENWRYGMGMPIQLDATTGGLLVNIRQNGTPYSDHEVGCDLIKFNSLDNISAKEAMPVSRSIHEPNPWTGTPSVTSKYPMMGGFVPFGGRFADGSLHPHDGTGFGIYEVGFYPAPGQPMPSRIGYQMEIQQLRYDGHQFTTSPPVRMPSLSVGSTDWKIVGVGMSPAIPDGHDLLCAVTCSNLPNTSIVGVARFQYVRDGWQPTSFVPVTSSSETWGESSLIRDIDGSLLFTARNDAASPFSVWGSTNGEDWKRLIHIVGARAYAPVTLNQTVDGTPFLVTTLASPNLAAPNDRNILQIVPINSARNGIGEPILLRNGPAEFGPGPITPVSDRKGWFIDHAVSNVIRLADGRWHCVITYRVDAKVEHYGQSSTPFTGYYVEEVSSSGEPRPMGLVFEP